MKIFAILLVVLFVKYSEGHSYNLGECPNVQPMTDFDMYKFLGSWYVIRKTSTSSSCVIYNFTRADEPDTYSIEEISHTIIPGKHGYHYTGELTVPDSAIPARMKVKFPLNFGSASYTVFLTDYDNFAAIFTCQKLPVGNRQSVSIISRRKALDNIYMEKIQNKLRTYNINLYDLSIISQKSCESLDGYNINVDGDTFSTKTIAGVVRKAGHKLRDGVEYVAGGAKKVYNSYGNNDNKENVENNRFFTPEPDAEWIL